MNNYPSSIRFVEVGPRDGFQNLEKFIPTEIKKKEIELLINSGVNEIEITSFVSPKAIPQVADAKEIAKWAAKKYGDKIKLIALVPNEKGAILAKECGIKNITFVISASETHNMENVNKTREESLSQLRRIKENVEDINVRLDIATAFGCVFEGEVPEDAIVWIIDEANKIGIKEIVLCDTVGMADPLFVSERTKAIADKCNALGITMGLHLHDTGGMGLASIFSSLNNDIKCVEGSVSGLGGCPYAPGAAGNIASEDMLNMLDGMSIKTGIDIEKYLLAAEYVKENIQTELTGRLINISKNI